MLSLVQPLFDGPLDIVGDVHGEIDALHALMQHLGYANEGRHPDGRRLVFVGDLIDRGANSPAVVALVQRLIESGRAQCALGNHELNILLNHPKHENKWFYGEEFHDEDGNVVPQVLADESIRRQVVQFSRTLPIALERNDLRVVHACWDDDMLSFARGSSNVVSLYHEHADRIEFDASSCPELDDIDTGLLHQNENPVKKLSLTQIEGIFTGSITDWSEVGGKAGKISLYTRNTSSGTYKSFAKLAMSKKDYASNSQKMEGNQPICTEVANNVNGIGYVGLAYAKGNDYKTVKVDGVSAKPSKVAQYPLARKLYYYTVGEPTSEVAAFLKYATSTDAANAIVEKIGFVPTPVANASMKASVTQ